MGVRDCIYELFPAMAVEILCKWEITCSGVSTMQQWLSRSIPSMMSPLKNSEAECQKGGSGIEYLCSCRNDNLTSPQNDGKRGIDTPIPDLVNPCYKRVYNS